MDQNDNKVNYYSLPKGQKKILQKEFNKTLEGKRALLLIIILSGIFVTVSIVGAVIAIVHRENSASYATTPTFMFTIFPSIIYTNKLEKWLLEEKNITLDRGIKRKKKQKKQDESLH
ncbi:MAG: hypothetical protein FWG21_05560 [Oscillospiraceae bacterium]|nr:hypothetical protein [Oscillospiraceae bacterium]